MRAVIIITVAFFVLDILIHWTQYRTLNIVVQDLEEAREEIKKNKLLIEEEEFLPIRWAKSDYEEWDVR